MIGLEPPKSAQQAKPLPLDQTVAHDIMERYNRFDKKKQMLSSSTWERIRI